MANQRKFSVTTMYHARCGICKALFIDRNRAQAVQEAEECFKTGVCLPYKADVGDIVTMDDWSGVRGAPTDLVVKIVERFFTMKTHFPRYIATAVDDPNDPKCRTYYEFGQDDFRLRQNAS